MSLYLLFPNTPAAQRADGANAIFVDASDEAAARAAASSLLGLPDNTPLAAFTAIVLSGDAIGPDWLVEGPVGPVRCGGWADHPVPTVRRSGDALPGAPAPGGTGLYLGFRGEPRLKRADGLNTLVVAATSVANAKAVAREMIGLPVLTGLDDFTWIKIANGVGSAFRNFVVEGTGPVRKNDPAVDDPRPVLRRSGSFL